MNKIALVALTLAALALPCGTAHAAEGSGTMRAAGQDGARAATAGVFDAAIAKFDWHPRHDGLLLSVGAVIDDIRVAAMARPHTRGAATFDEAWDQARMPSRRQLAGYLGIGYRATDTGFYAQAGVAAAATGVDEGPRHVRDRTVYPVLELGWSYRF